MKALPNKVVEDGWTLTAVVRCWPTDYISYKDLAAAGTSAAAATLGATPNTTLAD